MRKLTKILSLLFVFRGFDALIWPHLIPQQNPTDRETGVCDKNDAGSQCSESLTRLNGIVMSGLVNEITDNDLLKPPKPLDLYGYDDDDIFEQQSSTITEFLERLPKTGYDARLRPHVASKPVIVLSSMFIGGISSVSESNMDFTADIYFRQAWDDHRLRFNSSELGEHDSLSIGGDFIDFLWRPDTYIPNAKLALYHGVTRHNAFVRIMPHGHVKQSIRITVTAQCPMDFRLFPMDSQRCLLAIESFALHEKDIIYQWRQVIEQPSADGKQVVNIPPIAIGADAASLPQFSIRGFRAVETFQERIEGRNHSRLIVEIYFTRSLGYYLIQIYLPASLVVAISWVSFWIPRQSQPARVSLGVTTVLTLTMMTGQGISSLPKISYLKALDLFMIFCFSMVFLALIEYAMVSYGAKRAKSNKPNQPIRHHRRQKMNSQGETQQLSSPSTPFLPQSPRFTYEKTEQVYDDDDDDYDEDAWSLAFPSSLPSRIEWLSRFLFPASFFIFNVCYWNYFLNRRKEQTTDDGIPGFIEFHS